MGLLLQMHVRQIDLITVISDQLMISVQCSTCMQMYDCFQLSHLIMCTQQAGHIDDDDDDDGGDY